MTQTTELARGALLSLSQAADACGVSRSTIKRRLPEFGHAYQDRDGWKVPISDLLGAGLKLRPSPVTQPSEAVAPVSDPAQNGVDLGQAQARITTLMEELAAEKLARAIAETRATAYQAHIDDLRQAMRAITGPPAAQAASPAPEAVPTPPAAAQQPQRPAPEPLRVAPEPARRRWWQRG
jgi:hypothetical protein